MRCKSPAVEGSFAARPRSWPASGGEDALSLAVVDDRQDRGRSDSAAVAKHLWLGLMLLIVALIYAASTAAKDGAA